MRQLPPRTLDDHGERYIFSRERFMPRLYKDGTVWPDGSPRWAIGYGHTCSPAEVQAYQGVQLTQVEGVALFRNDMRPRLDELNSMIKVEIGDHQFDALASVAFNIGTAALKKSAIMQCLNAGDYAGAANHFQDWIYWHASPGAPLTRSDGLVLRRELDKQLFLLQDDDDQLFDQIVASARSNLDAIIAELPSLQPGRHIHDDPDDPDDDPISSPPEAAA